MKRFMSTNSGRSGAVCALMLVAQLTACGGGGGSSTPPVGNNPTPVPPPPPPPATVSLTLQGVVTDAPIANAVVTATVGGETFTVDADADGNYSLDIEIDESDADEFVTLTARGVDTQEFVEFTSLAGSFQTLAAAAGADGTLSSAENFATQITNVSTAAAVLMREANGGTAVTSDAALATLGAQINAQQLLDVATAIKLAVDLPEQYPLPDGATSILALATDSTTRQAFVDAVYEQDPQAFDDMQGELASDPGLSKPVDVAGLVERGGFTSAMLATDAGFTFNYNGRVVHFDLEEGGTGFMITDTHDQAMTWEVDGTKLNVTYTTPIETISYDTENCVDDGGIRQVEAHYVSAGATVTFLSDTQVAMKSTSHVTYADCESLEARDVTRTQARTVLSMANFAAIDTSEFIGATQTLYVWDATQNAVVADVADLGDGTGTTRLTDQSFTWSLVEDGKIIRAEFANGAVAEYLSFGDVDEVASDILWEVRAPNDGPVLMGAGASVFAEAADAVSFTVDEVIGRFYQFGVGDETYPDPRLKGFRLRFDADFRGAQEFDLIDEGGNVVIVDENADPSNRFRWTLDDSAVTVRRTWDVVTELEGCLHTEPNCELYDERRIIPLAMEGNRVYWIEERRSSWENGVTPDTPATRLVRFYDYEPLDAEAIGAGKLRVRASGERSRELIRGRTRR